MRSKKKSASTRNAKKSSIISASLRKKWANARKRSSNSNSFTKWTAPTATSPPAWTHFTPAVRPKRLVLATPEKDQRQAANRQRFCFRQHLCRGAWVALVAREKTSICHPGFPYNDWVTVLRFE